jgi:hypothetical protein
MDHPAYEQTVMHNGKWITLDEFQEIKRGIKARWEVALKAFVYLVMAAAVVWIVIPGVWNIIKG